MFTRKDVLRIHPRVEAFITDLRRNGAKIAVVTSSNEEKMANVYNAHPEFKGMVDRILTGEMFARSKPAPDCFLLGMEIFEATPKTPTSLRILSTAYKPA